jgi:hypothetical protein
MTAVVFSPSAFKVRYPEFSAVDDVRLSAFFDEATLYLSNTDKPVKDVVKRAMLFNMLVAHIATLGGVLASNSPAPVGRVASAGQGSVNVSTEYMQPGSYAWFVQTQYGAAFWQATVKYRSFRYYPCPTVVT